MTLEAQVSALTTATTQLLSAVNVGKATLDERANTSVAQAAAALASATAANTSAGASAGSAAQALAIYGSAALQQTAVAQAASQAAIAAGHAASAASVAQQDLSGVNAAALHRSPNAITSLFIYDTAKDSDGGAWRKRMADKSWMTEPLSGKWLGAHATHLAARGDNLIAFPEQLDTWLKVGTNVLPASEPVLGGKLLLNKLVENSTAGSHYTSAPGLPTAQIGQTFSFSVHAKAAERSVLQMVPSSGVFGNVWANFDLIAGTVSLVFGCTASITALGAGVFICAITVVATIAAPPTITFGLATSPTSTRIQGYTGDNVSGLFVGGAKGMLGTLLTPYVPHADQVGWYYQGTADGKFLKLNTDYSTTEVFRGNKAEFPALSAIVAESASVTIYDLTAPGNPMWMRFGVVGEAASPSRITALGGVTSISSVAAFNGRVLLGGSSVHASQAALVWEFTRDRFGNYSSSTTWAGWVLANLAQRNTLLPIELGSLPIIINSTVNAVAMTVLPDAPIDPVTGLQIPTIAVATGGGVSVIRADGTVVNDTTLLASVICGAVGFSPEGRLMRNWHDTNNRFGIFNGSEKIPTSSFSLISSYDLYFTIAAGTGPVQLPIPGTLFNSASKLKGTIGLYGPNGGVSFIKQNPSSRLNTLFAAITNTFNTGYMVGDIRRTLLADIGAGSVSDVNLYEDGTFSLGTTAGISIIGGTPLATQAIVNGEYEFTNNGGSFSAGRKSVPVVAGKTYLVTVTARRGTSVVPARLTVSALTPVSTNNTVNTVLFVYATATSAVLNVELGMEGVGNTGTAYFDNVSVREVIADRSYKNKPANIYGTLTKSAVSVGSQLVAYSGFSPANYIQEPASADLDFGTGAFTESVWVNYTTAAVSVIADRSAATGSRITFGTSATGQITATAFDGTTTHTVTSPAVYNNGTWHKARFRYSVDGALALDVNGVQVAVTTGAPLLTMNNANAVLTVGNNFALNAPFPGSISLAKIGATSPTTEQAQWIYGQEKQMFADGAQVCLPDSGAVVDLAYDELTDRWTSVSATNESAFTGLVRTRTSAVVAGTYTKVAKGAGVRLVARAATMPGVDITAPAQGLKEELVRRNEAAAAATKTLTVFDFDAIAAQVDFPLPVGWTATEVLSAGTSRREGATKDFIRLFDGFKETIRFAVAPGAAVWVQINARKV